MMPIQPSLLILCSMLIAVAGTLAWSLLLHWRDRQGAKEIIPLETAVCIQKKNGNVIIRQQRGKSVLGLALGIFLLLAGFGMFVSGMSNAAELGVGALCAGIGLLIFGVLTAWVSGRGFQEPDVAISVANRRVEFRRGVFGSTQAWLFNVISGVVRQSRSGEDILLDIAGALIDPKHTDSLNTNRTVISLRHSEGQEVRLCTATEKAAERVPEIIAAAMGKPVFTK